VELRILCPGLFGQVPLMEPPLGPTLGPLPTLDRLLDRADLEAIPGDDPLEILAAVFGITPPAGGDLPSAALSRLSDVPDRSPQGFWLHADPVHLRADRDRLLAFAGPRLGIEDAEARALMAAFNAHFASDGLALEVTDPGRWYLHAEVPPEIVTTPIHRVAGGPVDPHLPGGAGAGVWTRLQTEAQMLFHDHPVNRVRESAGRPMISGLWTWGGGVLPEVAAAGHRLVVADHPLARGLARAAGAEIQPIDGWRPGGSPAPAEVLVFWDRPWWPALDGDSDGWRSALVALDTWLAAPLEMLGRGALSALVLEDGRGTRFVATRGGLRRFWRRGGGLGARIEREGAPRV
jgi:hypothetical protein